MHEAGTQIEFATPASAFNCSHDKLTAARHVIAAGSLDCCFLVQFGMQQETDEGTA